ncbi:hypothetical protein RSPO_m00200 (plasmid) [Ralstonia solanacearum Po82]|uniref:Uncharacterized protein n=1 Tax=Ralstonia solanacearum (strain Po82) TaxID=1031711 RepID=F6G890_RALS8|nr:hypothetical protein RSPO_m00200 [Ralstonia solanacearum Po82]
MGRGAGIGHECIIPAFHGVAIAMARSRVGLRPRSGAPASGKREVAGSRRKHAFRRRPPYRCRGSGIVPPCGARPAHSEPAVRCASSHCRRAHPAGLFPPLRHRPARTRESDPLHANIEATLCHAEKSPGVTFKVPRRPPPPLRLSLAPVGTQARRPADHPLHAPPNSRG